MLAVYYNFMRGYVDGFVLAVPKKKIRAYKRLAEKAERVWGKHGALDYVEAVGNDLGSTWAGIKFPSTVKAKPSETVGFSYIGFKDRKQRDVANARRLSDPLMKDA